MPEVDNRAKAVEARAAESYDGRLVRRMVLGSTGASLEQWGVARYRGEQYAPLYLEVQYDDGTSEELTVRGFRALKPLPAGTPAPGSRELAEAARAENALSVHINLLSVARQCVCTWRAGHDGDPTRP